MSWTASEWTWQWDLQCAQSTELDWRDHETHRECYQDTGSSSRCSMRYLQLFPVSETHTRNTWVSFSDNYSMILPFLPHQTFSGRLRMQYPDWCQCVTLPPRQGQGAWRRVCLRVQDEQLLQRMTCGWEMTSHQWQSWACCHTPNVLDEPLSCNMRMVHRTFSPLAIRPRTRTNTFLMSQESVAADGR